MRNNTPAWFYFALVLVAVASAISLRFRVSAESRNKATTLAMDYGVLEASLPSGASVTDGLRQAREVGLGAVTVSEQTVAEASAAGLLRIEAADSGFQITGSEHTLSRLQVALRRSGSKFLVEGGVIKLAEANPEPLRNLSLGLPPAAVSAAREAGLKVIARYANNPSYSLDSIRALLAEGRADGAMAYLPEGEQVLGQRDLISGVADALREQGWLYCSAEFTKISGDEKLSAKMQDRLLRLHSIQSAEIDKLSPAEFMERMVKAARERNIRILLIRPISTTGAEPFSSVTDTIQSLRYNLSKEGVPIGEAKPFSDPTIPRAVFVLIGFGIAFVGLYALQNVTNDPRLFVLGALALVLSGALALSEGHRDIPALAAAIIFPCAAILWYEQNAAKLHPLVGYFAISVISLLGGLAGAGLLNGLAYYVKIDQFAGVKLAHIIPILFITVWAAKRRVRWSEFLANPVRWAGLFVLFGVMAVLAVMLMRTGNDNPAGVSGIELKLRSLMDWLFYTRPRTKEIFFGHPALVIGLFAAARARRTNESWAIWLGLVGIAVGSIGQTSIVNTFSHLHTPLLLSLARVGIGWAVGGLIGWVVWLVFQANLSRSEPSAA